MFPCCSTREDLFHWCINWTITIVGLILTKLRWFQLIVTSQNSNFELFWKSQILEFPCCSTREELSIDVSITNVGLILTKLWWFLFSGYGQTDRVFECSHGNMSAHKKFQLKTSGWPSIPICLPGGRGCINMITHCTFINTHASLFACIYIYIYIYICLIEKNGTLIVYYLFSRVFIFPN